ncbi:hypothetical protein Plhal304r1_c039g0116301 [Plasmopara halstedii]
MTACLAFKQTVHNVIVFLWIIGMRLAESCVLNKALLLECSHACTPKFSLSVSPEIPRNLLHSTHNPACKLFRILCPTLSHFLFSITYTERKSFRLMPLSKSLLTGNNFWSGAGYFKTSIMQILSTLKFSMSVTLTRIFLSSAIITSTLV